MKRERQAERPIRHRNMVSRRNPKVTDLNNFAISSDGLATALQDSASSLMAAGNNLEQSVAMVAAAIFYGCSYRNI